MSFKKASLLAVAFALTLSAGAVYADEPAASDKPADTGKAAEESAPKKPNRTLEGGVQGSVLLLDEGLNRINQAEEMIKESTEKIMKEATRKDTVVMRGPNYVGNGVVIPALGGNGGVLQMGEMPIRRDKLTKFLGDTEQTIAVLQNNIDALQIPPEQEPTLATIHSAMRATMSEVQDHLSRLKELAQAKRLANGKIGREALKIYDAMAQLEKQRKQLYEVANNTTSASK